MNNTQKVAYGVDRLKLHCEELNAMSWVRQSGRPYFISSKADANGVVTHYLDRKGS